MKKTIIFMMVCSSIFFLYSRFNFVAATDSSDKLTTGTYFSGYARWAKEFQDYSDDTIRQHLLAQSNAFHKSGASFAREDFAWATIEKSKGNFDWWATDIAMEHYNHKDNILVILSATPQWASSAPQGTSPGDIPKYPAKDINDWKNYVRQVVSRYKDKIKYWEIWNEADLPREFFYPKPGLSKEESYYELYKAAYETIKGIDPVLQVLTNGFGTWNITGDPNQPAIGDLMVKYIINHGGPYFDIFNIHVYSRDNPQEEIIKVKNLLNQFPAAANKPIWVTETNPMEYLKYNSQTGGNTVNNAAKYMEWWLTQQLEAGADRLFWFTILNWHCDEDCSDFQTAGLITIKGFNYQLTWYKLTKLIKGFLPVLKAYGTNFQEDDYNNDGKVNGIDFGKIKLLL